MGARLDEPPLPEDEDAVGISEGGKTVGDRDGGAPRRESVQRLLDIFLGFGVERGGGLIKDQDLGVVDQGSCNGDALSFPARKVVAVLPDRGIVALG